MRKIVAILMIMILSLIPMLSFATDYSKLSDDDLLNEINQIRAEIVKREMNPEKLICQNDGLTISMRGELKEEKFYDGSTELIIDYVAVNSSEKCLSVFFDKICINGWEISTIDGVTLDAGKKTMGQLTIYDVFSKVDFESLSEIEDIEFYYYTYTPDPYVELTKNARKKIIIK